MLSTVWNNLSYHHSTGGCTQNDYSIPSLASVGFTIMQNINFIDLFEISTDIITLSLSASLVQLSKYSTCNLHQFGHYVQTAKNTQFHPQYLFRSQNFGVFERQNWTVYGNATSIKDRILKCCMRIIRNKFSFERAEFYN